MHNPTYNRPRQWRTKSGATCDHIPSRLDGGKVAGFTLVHHDGVDIASGYVMHFGPYDNPQTNVVRADNVFPNPEYTRYASAR
jgi:hypothetical protein